MFATQSHRWSGLAAIVGGAFWAVTPLRDAIFGGGASPGETAFRPYNLAILIISALLFSGMAALHAHYGDQFGRSGTVGTWMIQVGYVLAFAGSLPAVLAPEGRIGGIVDIGQDLGFLGAIIGAIGAIPLGMALRHIKDVPRPASQMLIASFPVGFVGIVVISLLGFVDVAGLPMTALYGGAWMMLGYHLSSEERALAAA